MPDLTVTDVVFDVGITENDNMREAWQKAKARYEPETRARGIDFSKGLGPALDKWAVSYKTFGKSASALSKQKLLWTKVPIIARNKIKTEARALKTDATAVNKATAKYLSAIQVLGDADDEHSDSSAAKRDLTTILTKIQQRAIVHQIRARKVIDSH